MTFGRGIQFFDTNGGGGGGSVTNALNGTHLNGTIVFLGGELLENTFIDGKGFQYVVSTTNVTGVGTTFEQFPNIIALALNDTDTPSVITGALSLSRFGVGNAQLQATLSIGDTQNVFGTSTVGSESGWRWIDEISGGGIGDPIIGLTQEPGEPFVTPLQFLPGYQNLNEYNAFPAPFTSKFARSTLSISDNLLAYTPAGPLGSQLVAVRVAIALFANIVPGAACQAQIGYTDQNFIFQVIDLPSLVVTGDANYPPVTVIIAPGTDVLVNFVVTAVGVNATCIGGVEIIGFI